MQFLTKKPLLVAIFVLILIIIPASFWVYKNKIQPGIPHRPQTYSLATFSASSANTIAQSDSITGTAIPNANVIISFARGGVTAAVPVAANGTWTYQIPQTVAPGNYNVAFMVESPTSTVASVSTPVASVQNFQLDIMGSSNPSLPINTQPNQVILPIANPNQGASFSCPVPGGVISCGSSQGAPGVPACHCVGNYGVACNAQGRRGKAIDIISPGGSHFNDPIYLPTIKGQPLKWYFREDYDDGEGDGTTLRVFQSAPTADGVWTIHFIHALRTSCTPARDFSAAPCFSPGQEINDLSRPVAFMGLNSGIHVHVSVGLVGADWQSGNLQVDNPGWKYPDAEMQMCTPTTLSSQPQPDIIASINPPSSNDGDIYVVAAHVSAVGIGAEDSKSLITVSQNGDVIKAETVDNGILNPSSDEVNGIKDLPPLTVDHLPCGQYTATVVADYNHQITESDETNNTASQPFVVTANCAASIPSPSPTPSQSCTFFWQTRCPSGQCVNPGQSCGVISPSPTILPTPTPAPNGLIGGAGAPHPDLVVTEVSDSLGKVGINKFGTVINNLKVSPGQSDTFKVYVESGSYSNPTPPCVAQSLSGNSFQVSFKIPQTNFSASGIVTPKICNNSIKVKEVYEVSETDTWVAPTIPGIYQLTICVDPGNNVSETNALGTGETNNCVTVPVLVDNSSSQTYNANQINQNQGSSGVSGSLIPYTTSCDGPIPKIHLTIYHSDLDTTRVARYHYKPNNTAVDLNWIAGWSYTDAVSTFQQGSQFTNSPPASLADPDDYNAAVDAFNANPRPNADGTPYDGPPYEHYSIIPGDKYQYFIDGVLFTGIPDQHDTTGLITAPRCGPTPSSTPTASVSPSINPCLQGSPIPANDTINTINVGGISRQYKIHYPDNYDRGSTPLVLNFHGVGGNGLVEEQVTGMDHTADQKGFIVVYPQGLPDPYSGGPVSAGVWNVGDSVSLTTPRDDVAFSKEVIDDVSSHFCVNQNKIYATGFSLGGAMAYKLACDMSDKIAAVAPVATARGDSCGNLSRSVPIVAFNNLGDQVVPVSGNVATTSVNSQAIMSVNASLAPFLAKANCNSNTTNLYTDGNNSCDAYQSCSSPVEKCSIDNANHEWPSSFNVNNLMWDFMSQYGLDSTPAPTNTTAALSQKQLVKITLDDGQEIWPQNPNGIDLDLTNKTVYEVIITYKDEQGVEKIAIRGLTFTKPATPTPTPNFVLDNPISLPSPTSQPAPTISSPGSSSQIVLSGTSDCTNNEASIHLNWTNNTSDNQFNIIKDGIIMTSTLGTNWEGTMSDTQPHTWKVFAISSSINSNLITVQNVSCNTVDLAAKNLSFSPGQPRIGTPMSFNADVSNIGNKQAVPSNTALGVIRSHNLSDVCDTNSAFDTFIYITPPTNELLSGASQHFSYPNSWAPSQPGKYCFAVIADFNNVTGDQNAGNNRAGVPFSVSSP